VDQGLSPPRRFAFQGQESHTQAIVTFGRQFKIKGLAQKSVRQAHQKPGPVPGIRVGPGRPPVSQIAQSR
jgi:hypothetical protein